MKRAITRAAKSKYQVYWPVSFIIDLRSRFTNQTSKVLLLRAVILSR